jgi:hypothetical protein
MCLPVAMIPTELTPSDSYYLMNSVMLLIYCRLMLSVYSVLTSCSSISVVCFVCRILVNYE